MQELRCDFVGFINKDSPYSTKVIIFTSKFLISDD